MKKILLASLLACSMVLPALAAPATPNASPTPKVTKSSPKETKAKSNEPGAAPKIKEEIVDINSADEKTLRTIPGIGKVYAGKIIQGRPYTGKDELISRKILPRVVYAKIKDRIIAHRKK